MEISHPRRILAVSRPDSGLLDLIKGLTGSVPALATDSPAGTTHIWSIKTNYYEADIPIWLDEILEPKVWSSEFLAPEAREVLTVLGAFIVCFRKPLNEAEMKDVISLLHNVAEVVKEGCGYSWDGVCLAVLMPQSTTPCLEKSFEEWEELCQESGFEFIDFEDKGRNEYAEPVGVERLKEALEANGWDGEEDDMGELGESREKENIEAGGRMEFGFDPTDLQSDMAGMKQAIYGSGDLYEEEDQYGHEDVEELQAMMSKMQAARGTELPEAERKRFAAKAVAEIMKAL